MDSKAVSGGLLKLQTAVTHGPQPHALNIICCGPEIPRGEDFHMKGAGMLVGN